MLENVNVHGLANITGWGIHQPQKAEKRNMFHIVNLSSPPAIFEFISPREWKLKKCTGFSTWAWVCSYLPDGNAQDALKFIGKHYTAR
jgi:phosphoribosylaminoimidazole (AIR) synthetase